MKLNEISDRIGATKAKKRAGRGIGSGIGKTGGRGVKGQKSRSGVAIKGFEGGQMPLYQRLPKRGFNNVFGNDFAEVTLGRLQAAIDSSKLSNDGVIDAKALKAAGVIKRIKDGVRVIGGGELTAKVSLKVAGTSKPAAAAIEQAGGSIELEAAKADEKAA